MKKSDIDKVLAVVDLSVTLGESIGSIVSRLHDAGQVTDDQLVAALGRKTEGDDNWDERVAAVKARLKG